MSDTYPFAPSERPLLPGSPYSPAHPAWRRMAYVGAAVLAAVVASLGNALVSTNAAYIAGSVGEYITVIALLPAVYVAFNATGNLSLVKARIQWGIPAITHGALIAYTIAALLQLVFPSLVLAFAVRAASGLSAAALITVAIYYLFQVFPPRLRPAALVMGLGLVQLGVPLARLFPVEDLARHHWLHLHLIELALPLSMLAVMNILPLPPSDRDNAFQPLDVATIALTVAAMLLLCVVLGVGRLYWWVDAPWLGWTLAGSIALFTGAFLVEANRANPLVYLNWIGRAVILRFAAVALLMRLALAEQTYGSVGLLTSSGLDNDQLRLVFGIVIGAMLLGIGTAIITLHPQRLRQQVVVAALSIACGAWLDSHATNLTGPRELYLSQALIGFGTTLFIGPTLAFGFLRMLERGPGYFVSLVVLFSITQNVGGLMGSALLGSLQFASTRAHAAALAEHLSAADPQVVSRIQAGAQLAARASTDPLQQGLQGSALLGQAQAREATVLAFNDVFHFVALLALATAGLVALLILRDIWRTRQQAVLGVSA